MFKQKSGKAVIAAAVSLMLLLSACGTTPTDNSGATSRPEAAITSQAQEEGARIVQAANGKIEVPTIPKRLVVSGFTYGDIIPFDLKNISIGLESWAELSNKTQKWHDYWGHLTKNTTLFSQMRDLESIMEMNPDIIIASTGQVNEKSAEELRKIAPTVLYDQENINRTENTIEKRMTFLGEVFGAPQKAQELINEFNNKMDITLKKLKDTSLASKKIVFIHGVENGTPLLATDINQAMVYDILGMPAPSKVAQEIFYHNRTPDDLHYAHVKELSLEVLPQYLEDADIIIYRHFDKNEESIASKLSQIEVWNTIPAVKNGNVLYASTNEALYGFSYADYMVMMENFVDMLSALPIAKN